MSQDINYTSPKLTQAYMASNHVLNMAHQNSSIQNLATFLGALLMLCVCAASLLSSSVCVCMFVQLLHACCSMSLYCVYVRMCTNTKDLDNFATFLHLIYLYYLVLNHLYFNIYNYHEMFNQNVFKHGLKVEN